MIVRAATAASFPVHFSTGSPDGGVDWEVRDQGGVLLDSGTLVPAVGAVSAVLTMSPAVHTLEVDQLTSTRDLSWSYEVSGFVVNGETRYTVEARLPFGVSAAGVRSKLGVDVTDLPDADVPLVPAYYAFREAVGQAELDAVSDPDDCLTVMNAVEALAAIALLPTMPVRIASKESSGTNQFQRQKIDWEAIRVALEALVSIAYIELIPGFDETALFGPLLILAKPDIDPLTGATV